jgi:hypothetical protein
MDVIKTNFDLTCKYTIYVYIYLSLSIAIPKLQLRLRASWWPKQTEPHFGQEPWGLYTHDTKEL